MISSTASRSSLLFSDQPSRVPWFDASADVIALLAEAAHHWHNTERAQQAIEQAIALGQGSPDVLIAAYRYFFYKNNGEMALWMTHMTMDYVRQVEQLPEDWEELEPLLRSRKEEGLVRLYLHAYAASGLLLAKLGDLNGAMAIATRIKALDDQREFGGDLLHTILTTPPDDDDE